MEDEFKGRLFIVERSGKLGLGTAYIAGFKWALERDYGYIFEMDADFASCYVRLVTGVNIHDTTAGFVCYTRRVLETIPLDEVRFKGYAFQIEMKYTAYKIGFKLKEVSVVFTNRREGTSKMSGGIFSEALFGVVRLRLDGFFRRYPKIKA